MKSIMMFMAALLLIAGLPRSCNQPADNGGEDVEIPDTPTPSAAELVVMVYSNAYDGFLNVREQPDVKSPIIGKILNGPMGAVKMGEIGGWTIVKVGETIGYASSRYLQTEPTKEFTDKDMEKCLRSIWISKPGENQRVVVLMKNGVFVKGLYTDEWTACGTWSVSGSVLSLHYTYVTADGGAHWEVNDGHENWTIVNGDVITDPAPFTYSKQKILSKKAYEALESPKFYEMDEEEYKLLEEGIGNIVSGNFS